MSNDLKEINSIINIYCMIQRKHDMSSSSGRALFIQTPHTAQGAVGVFTYDLLNKSTNDSTEKMAVMFSVPYDFNLYSNWFAAGIFVKSRECNYDLYHQMYYDTGKIFTREKAGSGLRVKPDSIPSLLNITGWISTLYPQGQKENVLRS
uniref:Actinoporin-like protein n=1 Tax=Lates calcarifer TaxID=8187 RepID=A0A4W6ELC0_LATCA